MLYSALKSTAFVHQLAYYLKKIKYIVINVKRNNIFF